MAKTNKCLTILLIVIIVAAVFFLLIPAWSSAGRFDVTLYNSEGQEVHVPYSLIPFSAVTSGGQEIVAFSLTVGWFTSDPSVNKVDWAISLEVFYVIDDIVPIQTVTVWDGLVWVDDRGSIDMAPEGGEESSVQFPIHTYCNDVPEDQTFFMRFYGGFRFINMHAAGTHEPTTTQVIFEGLFAEHTMTCYHESYEYQAWFGT